LPFCARLIIPEAHLFAVRNASTALPPSQGTLLALSSSEIQSSHFYFARLAHAVSNFSPSQFLQLFSFAIVHWVLPFLSFPAELTIPKGSAARASSLAARFGPARPFSPVSAFSLHNSFKSSFLPSFSPPSQSSPSVCERDLFLLLRAMKGNESRPDHSKLSSASPRSVTSRILFGSFFRTSLQGKLAGPRLDFISGNEHFCIWLCPLSLSCFFSALLIRPLFRPAFTPFSPSVWGRSSGLLEWPFIG